MRITDVDTHTLQVPIDGTVGDSRLSITDVYWIVVEIETDVGFTGTGWMGSLGFGPELLDRFVDAQFTEFLLGRDPYELQGIREDLRRQTIYYGETGMSAWPRGAIDVALWDLKAKDAGEPLFRYLGGSNRQVPAYVSLMDATVEEIDDLRGRHASWVEEGFEAVKTKLGDRSVDQDSGRIQAIREGIGDGPEIFVDANQAWTVKEAIEHVGAIAPHDVGWVEEPISEFDRAGHQRVTAAIDPPLATGEMFYRPERFMYLLEDGLDIVQPDLVRLGGISGMVEAMQLADRHHKPLAPHFYYAVSAHIVSAAPTGMITEYIPAYDIAPILEEPPIVEEGAIHLPERPGHGYAIDSSAKREYAVDLDSQESQ